MMSKFDAKVLYDRYRVKIAMRGRLVGGQPKRKELLEGWIKARTGHDDAQTAEQVKAAEETMPQCSEDEDKIDGCWTGFASDEHGPFVWCRQVKAMIKQSASVLGITKKKIGSKQILAEGAEVKALDGGDRLRWLPADAPVLDEERPIHVQTAKGPRTALKRVDYVERVTFDFEIWVLKTAAAEKRHIGEQELVLILTHAQENGLGADRSCGQGKFDVVEFTRLE